MLDATPDHVALCHRDDVRHAVARVDNRPRERALLDLLRGPRGREREHRLHGDVEPLDVERLEHDLRGGLAVLRRVHRRLRQQDVVLLRVAPQVLEDAALPVALHIVPVLDDAVPDGVVDRVLIRARCRLIADPEVEVLDALPVWSRFGRILGADERRDDEGGLAVACVAHLCIPGAIVDDDSRDRHSRVALRRGASAL